MNRRSIGMSDYHYLFKPREINGRLHFDFLSDSVGLPSDLDHRSHGYAFREVAAQAAGEEQVSGLDVIHAESEFQLAKRVRKALDDSPDPGAKNVGVDRRKRIEKGHHIRSVPVGAKHSSHNPFGVDHGHVRLDSTEFAPVDPDRTEFARNILGDHAGDHGFHLVGLFELKQAPEADVFLFELSQVQDRVDELSVLVNQGLIFRTGSPKRDVVFIKPHYGIKSPMNGDFKGSGQSQGNAVIGPVVPGRAIQGVDGEEWNKQKEE